MYRILGKVNGSWLVYPRAFDTLEIAEVAVNQFRQVTGHFNELKLIAGSLKRAEKVAEGWTKEGR